MFAVRRNGVWRGTFESSGIASKTAKVESRLHGKAEVVRLEDMHTLVVFENGRFVKASVEAK